MTPSKMPLTGANSIALLAIIFSSIFTLNPAQAQAPNKAKPTAHTVIAQQNNSVVGRWRYTLRTNGSDPFSQSFVMGDYTFRANGTFKNNMPRINKGGRYEVAGNSIVLNYGDGEREEYQYELVVNTYSSGKMHSIRLTSPNGETRQFGLWDSQRKVYY
jgi:Lipocalin-like domain